MISAEDGTWSGIVVDLWTAVAQELDRPFQLEARELTGLFHGLEDRSLDVVVPAALVPEREERMDFTVPFFATTLAVANPVDPGVRDVMHRFSERMVGPRVCHDAERRSRSEAVLRIAAYHQRAGLRD